MVPTVEAFKALCPIYAASDTPKPDLIGSGVLLDFGKARFFATAAHAADTIQGRKSGFFLPIPDGFIAIGDRCISTSVPLSGVRDDDKIDFAFLRIDDSAADEIAKTRSFLPFPLIDLHDRLTPKSKYIFTGYPLNREKKDGARKKVTPVPYSFLGSTASVKEIKEVGFSPAGNIVVKFNRDTVFADDGSKAVFPLPQGMSGGPIWKGEGNPHDWLAKSTVKLVGLGIEVPEIRGRPRGVMVGVRISLIVAALIQTCPEVKELGLMQPSDMPKISISSSGFAGSS
jgi:hypothetical protein